MILVFKTSVKSKRQIRQLQPHINECLPDAQWNFDLQDRDHILRIDNEEDVTHRVIDLLNSHQFYCEELQ